MFASFKRQSLARQSALISVLICTVTFSALNLFVSHFSDKAALKQTETLLSAQIHGVVSVLEEDMANTRSQASKTLGLVKGHLPGKLSVSDETMNLGGAHHVRIIKAGGTVLNGNAELLQKLKNDTGGADPAIFVRHGDSFLRAATLLKDAEGKPTHGSTVKDGQDTAEVLAGKTYSGVVLRNGKYFISTIEPIFDDKGQVAGALSVRMSIDEAIERVRKTVGEMKTGETGYPYIVAPAAKLEDTLFIAHPKFTGKTLAEINNPKLTAIIKHFLDNKEGAHYYMWPDASGKERQKVVGFAPSTGWGWHVATGSFVEEFTAEARQMRNYLIMLSFACGVLTVIVLSLVMRHQLQPLQNVTAAMERLGAGDLSQQVAVTTGPSANEIELISRQINQTQAQMGDVLRELIQTSGEVEQAAMRLDDASRQVVSSSARQSSEASNLAAAVEELSVSISHVADHAHDASEHTQSARQSAINGRSAVHEMVDDMHNVAEQIHLAVATVNRLGDQTTQISSVIEVIKGIAEQTNLLALNAAIEAARAGESGRGFAVVADEVRKLAERTSHSTEEIASTISSVQVEASNAVGQINNMSTRITASVELANQTGVALEELAAQNESTAGTVGEIASATREQSIASQSVAQGVEEIAQMAENNTTITEVSAQQTVNLVASAQRLRGMVSRFRT